MTELDPIVEEAGVVVVGLFESDTDPLIDTFTKVVSSYKVRCP